MGSFSPWDGIPPGVRGGMGGLGGPRRGPSGEEAWELLGGPSRWLQSSSPSGICHCQMLPTSVTVIISRVKGSVWASLWLAAVVGNSALHSPWCGTFPLSSAAKPPFLTPCSAATPDMPLDTWGVRILGPSRGRTVGLPGGSAIPCCQGQAAMHSRLMAALLLMREGGGSSL